MTESRWANWSPGTLKTGLRTIGQFMEEAPMQAGMGTRSAADEAREAGLTHAGYGYYKDNTGQVVAQSRDGKLVYIDQTDGKMQPSQVDMGNPTSTASGQTPADKARSMGLVSDGSGSYKDSQGNTIARTVNNELVFYDSRAGGGAVSDGSGGAMITQSAPSWVDPVTGLIVVPPAQPESPEEINAVPDATPAQAPYGYDAFVTKKKKEMYRQNYVQTEIQQDIDRQQAEVDEIINSSPALQEFKIKIDDVIERGQSGSENAQDLAQRVKRISEDTELLAEFQYVGEQIGDDLQAADLFKKSVIQRAKLEKMNELRAQYAEEGYEGNQIYDMIDLEYPKLASGATNSQYEDTLEKMGVRTPKQQEQDALAAEEESFDTEMGINDERQKLPSESIEGEKVTYTLTYPGEPPAPASFEEKDKKKMQKDVLRKAAAAAKKFKQKPGDVVSITWDGKEEKGNDSIENKRVALDALKTWRNQVLPRLSPGTVVHNDPAGGGRGGDQRERIYQMAGFGDYNDEYEGQYGIVVQQDGKNIVIPVDFSTPKSGRKKKLQESVIRYIDFAISDHQVNRMYEALFE